MRLAIIPSAYRTVFAHALGLRLEREGHEIYWLSPNRRWATWLSTQGVSRDRILDITDHAKEWKETRQPSRSDRDELRELERANGWTFHDLILMDDLLKHRPAPYALRYLAVCARHVRTFLQTRGIQVVSGELTWAFELLVGQVCGSLRVPFLRPSAVRIPDGRFAFFGSHYEKDTLTFRDPTDLDRARAKQMLGAYRSRPVPPDYMAVDWSVLQFRWGRIRLLIRHVLDVAGDPHDETSLRPLPLIGKYLARTWRARRNRRLHLFHKPVLPPDRPFVLFTLHLQPEATINVMGSPFCNQVELVRALARTLPATHELWVKEHRVALPVRPHAFYQELVAIPGVRLIDPFASSLAIIPHADLVISVTGTASYEAALLGRPGATIAPTLFGPILTASRFNPFTDSLTTLLESTRTRPPRTDEEVVDFLAWLLAQSWPGSVGDALWEPSCMASDNVERVALAFTVALGKIASDRLQSSPA